MVDDKPFSAGEKINWPMAIGISLALHAAVLGAVFFTHGGGETASEGRQGQGGEGETASVRQQEGEGGGGETASVRQQGGETASGRQQGGETASGRQQGEEEEYTVKPGDSLTKIAKKQGCTVADIAKLNGFQPNKMLSIGEKIKVPAKPAE